MAISQLGGELNMRKCLTQIRLIWASLVLFFASVTQGAEHGHNLMGSHGMLVFSDNYQNLYVSHMPLYVSPHDYQIIYKLKVKEKARVQALLANGLVTLLPQVFDLQRMLDGKAFSVRAQFYQGHFERGGEVVLDTEVWFEAPILNTRLDSTAKSEHASFYALPITQDLTLLVHKIQPRPSFDAIGFIKGKGGANGRVLDCDQPSELTPESIRQQLLRCGFSTVSYIEVQDFSAN